jgi:hypothetical protein
MKIVLVSDIHANLAALEALPEDLVDYGPRPHETIRWMTQGPRSAAIMTGQIAAPGAGQRYCWLVRAERDDFYQKEQ